jgi:hypothetical protein
MNAAQLLAERELRRKAKAAGVDYVTFRRRLEKRRAAKGQRVELAEPWSLV